MDNDIDEFGELSQNLDLTSSRTHQDQIDAYCVSIVLGIMAYHPSNDYKYLYNDFDPCLNRKTRMAHNIFQHGTHVNNVIMSHDQESLRLCKKVQKLIDPYMIIW